MLLPDERVAGRTLPPPPHPRVYATGNIIHLVDRAVEVAVPDVGDRTWQSRADSDRSSIGPLATAGQTPRRLALSLATRPALRDLQRTVTLTLDRGATNSYIPSMSRSTFCLL